MKDDDFTKSFWRKFCTTGRIPLSCVFALDRRSDRRTAGLRHRVVQLRQRKGDTLLYEVKQLQ